MADRDGLPAWAGPAALAFAAGLAGGLAVTRWRAGGLRATAASIERGISQGQRNKDVVRNTYAATAQGESLQEAAGGATSGCCDGISGDDQRDHAHIASQMGYSKADLVGVGDANLGLGCGHPVQYAKLKKGEVVVDLGSGPGLDSLLAARGVGPTGAVIGVDMTPEMIARSRENVKSLPQREYGNVFFRLGEIEHLPVGDSVADVSGCACVLLRGGERGGRGGGAE